MKPIKKDHYQCGNCGNDEIVLAGKTPKIMSIVVVGNEHQWCPNCVYAIKSWRVHVNEDHLCGPKRDTNKETSEYNDLLSGVKNRLSKHSNAMEHLNEKTGEITKFNQ